MLSHTWYVLEVLDGRGVPLCSVSPTPAYLKPPTGVYCVYLCERQRCSGAFTLVSADDDGNCSSGRISLSGSFTPIFAPSSPASASRKIVECLFWSSLDDSRTDRGGDDGG